MLFLINFWHFPETIDDIRVTLTNLIYDLIWKIVD